MVAVPSSGPTIDRSWRHAGGAAEFARALGRAADAGGVLIAARHGSDLVAEGVAGLSAPSVRALLSVLSPIDAASSPAVAALGEVGEAEAEAVRRSGFRRAFYAPLEVLEEDVGILCLLFRDGVVPHDQVVLDSARHAALALERARARTRRSLSAQVLELQAELDRFPISTSSEEELSAKVAAALARILGVPMTGLMVYDEDRRVLQMTAGSFGAYDERVSSYQISALDPRSNAARVFATGQPYLSNDAAGDPAIRPAYVEAFGIERVLSVPLAVGTRPIGVLHLANKEQDFTMDDLVRAEALAPRVATAVELARASFRLRRERRLEGVLSVLAVGIASGESLQALLPVAFGDLSALIEASLVALIPTDGKSVVHRRCDVCPELEAAVLRPCRAEDVAAPGVQAPQAVGDPGWATFHAPVTLDGARVGVLAALRCRAEPFAADERRALSRVAQLAGLAWATESYQQQAAQLARLQERQQVSGELHADVQHLLVEAQSRLESTLDERPVDASSSERINHARGLLIRGFSAIRSVAFQLARPAGCDLPLRLRAASSSVEDEFGLPVRFELSPKAAGVARELPAPLADILVKAARETLVNVAKHGGGNCRATLRLDIGRDDRVLLSVVDDGLGVSPRQRSRGHGLTALRRELREHGGRLQVRAVATGGTRVLATVPVRR